MSRIGLLIGAAAFAAVTGLTGCAEVVSTMGPPMYAPNAAEWSGERTGIYVGVGGPIEMNEITDLRIVVRQVRMPIPATDPVLPPQP